MEPSRARRVHLDALRRSSIDLVGSTSFSRNRPVRGNSPNIGTPCSMRSTTPRWLGKPASASISPKKR
eukprot:13590865-Heterocapsa_arctica.AAC.1